MKMSPTQRAASITRNEYPPPLPATHLREEETEKKEISVKFYPNYQHF
jgi:hypothetical protein